MGGNTDEGLKSLENLFKSSTSEQQENGGENKTLTNETSEQSSDKVTKIITGEKKIENPNSNFLVLPTGSGQENIPYSAGIKFIQENPDQVNMEKIYQLFKGYDGSFDSIEEIFNTLKNEGLERLRNFDGNINEIFGEDFKELLKELNSKLKGTEKDKKNYLLVDKTSKGVTNFIRKVIKKVINDGTQEILERIKGTSNFVVTANNQIENKIEEARKITDISKKENKELTTNYAIYLILQHIIEKKLSGNNFEKDYEKQLFEARLSGIKSQLVNISNTLNMSKGVTGKVNTTIINISTSYENLITTLNTFIITINIIETLNDINQITGILKNLQQMSVEQTSQVYLNLLDNIVEQLEKEIEYQKTLQNTVTNNLKKEEETQEKIKKLKGELKQKEENTAKLGEKIFSELQNKQNSQIEQ